MAAVVPALGQFPAGRTVRRTHVTPRKTPKVAQRSQLQFRRKPLKIRGLMAVFSGRGAKKRSHFDLPASRTRERPAGGGRGGVTTFARLDPRWRPASSTPGFRRRTRPQGKGLASHEVLREIFLGRD